MNGIKAVIAFIFIAIVIGVVIWVVADRKAIKDKLIDEVALTDSLSFELMKAKSTRDTIWMPGQYVIDTIPTVDTIEVGNKVEYIESSVVVDQLKIDTLKTFEWADNVFSIRVQGEFYFPSEYSYRNRLLIYPTSFVPAKRESKIIRVDKSPRVGIGLSIYMPYSAGAYLRHKRMMIVAMKDLTINQWRFGLNYELIRF